MCQNLNLDPDAVRGLTHATIRAAFNSSPEIMHEHGDAGHTNITGITTRLIRDVGRFSERWSSDALYGIDKLRAVAEQGIALDTDCPCLDEIITFGIRQDGVDHDAFVMQNLLESRRMPAGYVFPKQIYRRILAVRMRVWPDADTHRIATDFSLRDITNDIHSIQPADLDGTGSKIVQLPFEDRRNPEPDENHKLDKAEIRKTLSDGPFVYKSREVASDELATDGCVSDGEIACTEIFRVAASPVVPENRNKPVPVCRVYKDGASKIVVWLDPWSRHVSAAADLIPD